jgi:hypothetical protein
MSELIRTWVGYAACLGLAAGLIGCGSGGVSKGTVKGKVVANGQPVTGGSITFVSTDPASGATPASGEVKSDGTFEMMTTKPGDGAPIGKHTVSFSPPFVEQPEWDGYGTQPPQKEVPYVGLVPKETTVEVKSGANEITIELVPPGSAGQ